MVKRTPRTVQESIWDLGFWVFSLQDRHALSVAEDCVPLLAPLPFTCLHEEVFLVALGWEHQAVVLIPAETRRYQGRRQNK